MRTLGRGEGEVGIHPEDGGDTSVITRSTGRYISEDDILLSHENLKSYKKRYLDCRFLRGGKCSFLNLHSPHSDSLRGPESGRSQRSGTGLMRSERCNAPVPSVGRKNLSSPPVDGVIVLPEYETTAGIILSQGIISTTTSHVKDFQETSSVTLPKNYFNFGDRTLRHPC
jgi:hypothetical protein